LANRSGIQASLQDVHEWVALPEFKAAVLDDMQKRLSLNGGDSRLKAFERVRDIHITREPFSIDNGLLTPTLKLKRFVVKKRYQRELDGMYDAASAAEACRQRRVSNEMRDRRQSNPGNAPAFM
jgi:long-subunit acyl-CoA synthetase (AMP-forming)